MHVVQTPLTRIVGKISPNPEKNTFPLKSVKREAKLSILDAGKLWLIFLVIFVRMIIHNINLGVIKL